MDTSWKAGQFSNADVDSAEDVARITVRDQDALFLSFLVGTANLTAFTVSFRLSPSGDDFVVASASGHYTSPTGVVLGASGDLTTAAAGSTVHWLKLDVRGVESVLIRAAGTSSTITGDFGAN